jgi:chromosome segregation ATPase
MDNPLKDLILPDPKEIPESTRYTLGLILQYHEQTRGIVEELISDLRELRNSNENIAVLDNRIASLENKLGEFTTHCKECSKKMLDSFIKDSDRCNTMEKVAIVAHNEIREDLSKQFDNSLEKLENKFVAYKEELSKKFHTLDKQVAVNTIKITFVVAIVLWLLKFVGTILFNQIMKGNTFLHHP